MSETEGTTRQKILLAFTEAVGKVPAYLVSTKEGVGLVSILVGASMKAVGLGDKLQLKAEFRSAENWLQTVYYPAIAKDNLQGPDEEAAFCRRHPSSSAGAAFCEVVNTLTVDAFPFNLKIAGVDIIPSDFGKMPVADLLIGGGFMCLSADFMGGFLKGLGEVVPG